MFPAGVSIRKASGIRSLALSSREPFLLMWFIHNIKQCVTEYINSIYSSSLFQLFTKACTCCTLFLYTAGPSHVLMGEEHNNLCWRDSSSSTHFLLVLHYFCFCQLLVVHLPHVPQFFALTFCPHLNSKLVLWTLLFLLFLNKPILIYSVFFGQPWTRFFLYDRNVTGRIHHLCPLSHSVPFWPPKSIIAQCRSLHHQQNQLGGSPILKWLLTWLLTSSLEA